jgi:Flp pilus assembly protein TadB
MTAAPTIGLAPAQWVPLAVGAGAAALWLAFAVRRAGAQPKAVPEAAQVRSARGPSESSVPFLVGLAVAGAVWLLSGQPGPAAALMAAWYAVLTLVRARRRARRAAEQEAHALAVIGTASRALRAGIPLPGVIGILAKEGEGDAGDAFREIVQRESMGEDLPSAVRRVLMPISIPSLRAFGLALSVQLGSGGNIADTAERLSRALVERRRVRRRARTAVAYGRAAAIILGLLPLLVIPVLSVSVDGYASFLFERPFGNMLLATSAALVSVGLVVVQRMCRIDDAPGGKPS